MMEDEYDFLEQRDGSVKFSPKQTDYLLWLLKSMLEGNPHLDGGDSHDIKDMINKLELSRGKG